MELGEEKDEDGFSALVEAGLDREPIRSSLKALCGAPDDFYSKHVEALRGKSQAPRPGSTRNSRGFSHVSMFCADEIDDTQLAALKEQMAAYRASIRPFGSLDAFRDSLPPTREGAADAVRMMFSKNLKAPNSEEAMGERTREARECGSPLRAFLVRYELLTHQAKARKRKSACADFKVRKKAADKRYKMKVRRFMSDKDNNKKKANVKKYGKTNQ